MPEIKDLLKAAQEFDAGQAAHTVKIGKALLAVPMQPAATIPPVHELSLIAEDEDPFAGNLNNRRVAERVASQNRTIYTNVHKIVHTGDPGKAARDVELSKKLNPDSVSASEQAELDAQKSAAALRNKPKPTPGSPAAAKAEATGEPTAPKTWTPGAAGPAK